MLQDVALPQTPTFFADMAPLMRFSNLQSLHLGCAKFREGLNIDVRGILEVRDTISDVHGLQSCNSCAITKEFGIC